jgi:hypothetical protein
LPGQRQHLAQRIAHFRDGWRAFITNFWDLFCQLGKQVAGVFEIQAFSTRQPSDGVLGFDDAARIQASLTARRA